MIGDSIEIASARPSPSRSRNTVAPWVPTEIVQAPVESTLMEVLAGAGLIVETESAVLEIGLSRSGRPRYARTASLAARRSAVPSPSTSAQTRKPLCASPPSVESPISRGFASNDLDPSLRKTSTFRWSRTRPR